MSTITKEFTKEQLIARIERQIDINATIIERLGDDSAAASELAVENATMDMKILDMALASLEAEPIGAFHIADQQVGGTSDYIKDGEWPIDNGVIEVYAAPIVPAVPDERQTAPAYVKALTKNGAYIYGWNDCRAAMLNGADTVRDLSTPVDPQVAEYEKIMQQAVSDGWVVVPVDMTPEQMRAVQVKSELGAFAAANLSGAYSLFRELWDVAIAAAPQQE